jgi:hypothetical protein
MTALVDDKLSKIQSGALLAGTLALLLSFIGCLYTPQQFFVSYLFSYLYWTGLATGCFLVAMIHYLTGGQWGHPIRRFLEAGYSTLPILAFLFVPLLFGLTYLYPWARAGEMTDILEKKQPYLGRSFFITRVIVILTVWAIIALRLRKLSLTQDETKEASPSQRLARLSGPGLVIVPITATFAYIDWIMSTEPKWYSTVFAIIVLAGQVLLAYSFSVVLLKAFERIEPIASITSRRHYHQIGNLILTFVLFWTYVSFSQLLIIYAGNKPEEIAWYLHRIAGGWRYLLGAIALFHFFLPFLILLFRGFKRRSSLLALLALSLMAIHLLYAYWVVAPSIFPDGLHVSWLNFAVPLGLGGIWFAAFLWLLRRAPLVPLNDPRMHEEMAHA